MAGGKLLLGVLMLAAFGGLSIPAEASSAHQMTVVVVTLAMQLAQAAVDLTVKTFKECPDHTGLRNKFENIGLAVDNKTHTLLVSSTLHLQDTIKDGWTVHIILRKCFTDSPESCEVYMETDTDNFCNHIDAKGKIWSSIFSKMENFGPKCPVQPGQYKVVEGRIDLASLGEFDAMIGFWQLELEFMVKKEMVMCVMGDGEIYKKKNKRKPPKKKDEGEFVPL